MHEYFAHETDRYWLAFLKQWAFLRTHQIDPQFPGLYGEVDHDGRPLKTDKASNWKAAYHDGRALLLVSNRLRHLAQK